MLRGQEYFVSLMEGPDLKDLIQACLFDSKYLACCGNNPSQHIVCWLGNATVSQRTMLRRIITTARKILGVKQTGLDEIFNIRALRKAHKIILDPSHPLYSDFELLPSVCRYTAPPRDEKQN